MSAVTRSQGRFLQKIESAAEAEQLAIPKGQEAWRLVHEVAILKKIKEFFRAQDASDLGEQGGCRGKASILEHQDTTSSSSPRKKARMPNAMDDTKLEARKPSISWAAQTTFEQPPTRQANSAGAGNAEWQALSSYSSPSSLLAGQRMGPASTIESMQGYGHSRISGDEIRVVLEEARRHEVVRAAIQSLQNARSPAAPSHPSSQQLTHHQDPAILALLVELEGQSRVSSFGPSSTVEQHHHPAMLQNAPALAKNNTSPRVTNNPAVAALLSEMEEQRRAKRETMSLFATNQKDNHHQLQQQQAASMSSTPSDLLKGQLPREKRCDAEHVPATVDARNDVASVVALLERERLARLLATSQLNNSVLSQQVGRPLLNQHGKVAANLLGGTQDHGGADRIQMQSSVTPCQAADANDKKALLESTALAELALLGNAGPVTGGTSLLIGQHAAAPAAASLGSSRLNTTGEQPLYQRLYDILQSRSAAQGQSASAVPPVILCNNAVGQEAILPFVTRQLELRGSSMNNDRASLSSAATQTTATSSHPQEMVPALAYNQGLLEALRQAAAVERGRTPASTTSEQSAGLFEDLLSKTRKKE